MNLKVPAVLLILCLGSCGESPKVERPASTLNPDHIAQLMESLPSDSWLRQRLANGARGNGIHHSWMDGMRRHGVKRALVETHFIWFWGPRNLEVVRVMYCTQYDCEDAQVTDENRLKAISMGGLDHELKKMAFQRTRESRWSFETPPRELGLHGVSYVWLMDDEWLPEDPVTLSPQDPYWPPLFAAATLGDEVGVSRILAAGSSIKDRNKAMWTAANGRDTSVLKMLIKAGADVNAPGPEGATPLMFAVQAYEPQTSGSFWTQVPTWTRKIAGAIPRCCVPSEWTNRVQ